MVLGFAGAAGEKHSGDGEGWTVQTFSSVRMQCRTAGRRGGGAGSDPREDAVQDCGVEGRGAGSDPREDAVQDCGAERWGGRLRSP